MWGDPARGRMDRRIRRAVTLLRADLKQEFSIARLAAEVGLARSRFTQLFTKENRQGPKQYLMTLRLKRAAQLLAMTALPIKQVREEVGFRDKSGFAKRFKRMYGVSPSQFRKAHGIEAAEEQPKLTQVAEETSAEHKKEVR